MLYVAAIFTPQIAFAWLRRPWWTVFSVILLPILAIVTLTMAWWVVAFIAVRMVGEYNAEARRAEVRSIIAETA